MQHFRQQLKEQKAFVQNFIATPSQNEKNTNNENPSQNLRKKKKSAHFLQISCGMEKNTFPSTRNNTYKYLSGQALQET